MTNTLSFYLQQQYAKTTSIVILHECLIIRFIITASSAVDRGFEPRSSQTKDYKIGICCFSAKQPALRRKSKDWSARN